MEEGIFDEIGRNVALCERRCEWEESEPQWRKGRESDARMEEWIATLNLEARSRGDFTEASGRYSLV